MKLTSGLKAVLTMLLITFSPTGNAQSNAANSSETSQHSKAYSGYSVDGRTSASVLAAKRSHSVSKQDETGLAVYSGLIVIGLIVFFVHALSKKK